MTPEETAAAGEVIKAANGWLEKIFGPAAEQVGEMLGDWLQDKRELMQRNRRVVAGKVQTIMIEQKVTSKDISSKALIPMLEGISIEDDEYLQEMWANLFVNYIDSDKNLTLTVYPNILKQLSTNEARIIKYSLKNGPGSLFRFSALNHGERDGPMPYTDEEITNLMRLSLLEDEIEYKMPKPNRDGFGKDDIVVKKRLRYKITEFGNDFLKACERKK